MFVEVVAPCYQHRATLLRGVGNGVPQLAQT